MNSMFARKCRTSHQHYHRNVLVPRRSGRSQHGSLAMADKANSGRIDILVRGQKIQRQVHIPQKVVVRALILVSRRFANTAIIQTQHGNSGTSQVIREDPEWAMST